MAQQAPPPYLGIDGLYVQTDKHVDTTLAQYNGNARPGQLVVDTANYALYVGNASGQLTAVGGGSGGSATWATLGDKNNASGPTVIALGQEAGNTTAQGANTVAIGTLAGTDTQGENAIAIGAIAGQINQKDGAIAIGQFVGNDNQGFSAVAIGQNCAHTDQGDGAIAIGLAAGAFQQGSECVAVGQQSGATTQGSGSVALGYVAGQVNQGVNAVSIGRAAGNDAQGANAIAIGYQAGTLNQAQSSIIMNATGAALENTVPNTLVVKPIRVATAASLTGAGFVQLYYNATTGEIAAGTP